jgi:hypothetical protein
LLRAARQRVNGAQLDLGKSKIIFARKYLSFLIPNFLLRAARQRRATPAL